MTNKTVLSTIKSTVKSYLPDAKVLLFGSRARGDYNKDSDFDIMIITPQTLASEEKKSWRIKIKQTLTNALEVPIDILINSEKEIDAKKKLPGHTVRWAIKEGIVL
jgi:predicted nucleotidyltransferase